MEKLVANIGPPLLSETLQLCDGEVLRLTAYYAQQRVLCVTRTRVLKAVDEDEEIGNNRQQVED